MPPRPLHTILVDNVLKHYEHYRLNKDQVQRTMRHSQRKNEILEIFIAELLLNFL